jgi:putative component of membrane protein insertase Oxa1/YidC/SpoIIIJ protein YidD
MEVIKSISKILALPLVGFIWIYQRTLSPDHGLFRGLYPFGFCKFHPTCSEFARITLIQRGVFGLPQIIKRVMSCRPSALPQVHLP